MELQFTTASLPYYPLGATFALAQRLGVAGLELALTPILLHQGPARVERLAAAHGLEVRSLALGPLGHALPDADELAAVVRFATALPNCQLLVLPCPSGDPAGGGLGAYVAVLQRALELIAGTKLLLTVENSAPGHPAGPLDHFAQLRRLVEEWDLGFTFDTSHAAAQGWSITELLPAMGARLRNVHLSDFQLPVATDRAPVGTVSPRRLHRLPGDGVLPLRALLRALARRDYTGLLTLDLHPLSLRSWWPPAAAQRLAAALAFCQAASREAAPRPPFAPLERPSEAPAEAEAENEG